MGSVNADGTGGLRAVEKHLPHLNAHCSAQTIPAHCGSQVRPQHGGRPQADRQTSFAPHRVYRELLRVSLAASMLKLLTNQTWKNSDAVSRTSLNIAQLKSANSRQRVSNLILTFAPSSEVSKLRRARNDNPAACDDVYQLRKEFQTAPCQR